MSLYTAIGSEIWTWEPLRSIVHGHDDTIGFLAQLLWVQLYTIPEAKAGVPGLMRASVNTIAEATGKPADLVRTLLDRLIEHDLIEFDVAKRVLRMTILPDAYEFPHNDRAIKSWWRRFQSIPDCPLRNAHVTTLRWILDQHVRETGKGLKESHAQAWEDTFGTVAIPAARRRGRRHLQQELSFEPSGSGLSDNDASLSNTYPQPSTPISEKSKINDSADSGPTVVGQDQDQDPVSVSSLSGGGSGEGHDPGTASSSRPHLAIVPEDGPYGPELLLKTLEARSKNRCVSGVPDQTLWPALRASVAHLHAHGVTLADLELLSSWLARGLAVEGTEGRPYLGAWWVAKPNAVLFAVQRARIAEADDVRRRQEGERRAAEMRDVMSQGPYTIPTT